MFIEFLTQKEFFDKYMDIFATRFTVGNLEMEDEETDVADPKRVIEMYNSKYTFVSLIKSKKENLSPYDLIDINENIHKDIFFFPRGFRRTQVGVKKAKHFFPIPAYQVPQKIYSLFNNYYNVWKDLPIYEKEAMLHIELVRLQPFEDGNKRVARVVTCYNLCNQNKAPIIITGKETDEYFGYIDEYDIPSLTKMFKEKSENELEVMINLYRRICGDKICSEEPGKNNISLMNLVAEENIKSANSDRILKLERK